VLPSHGPFVRTSRAARARVARRRFPLLAAGISGPFAVFGSASQRSAAKYDAKAPYEAGNLCSKTLDSCGKTLIPAANPLISAPKPVIDETLYSNLRNLANGENDLNLLHIPPIGYNLARSGVARDASRRTQRSPHTH
jgi:hypothetical protein